MSHVEQRHRDAAGKWLMDAVDVPLHFTPDSLARLLADTERAALDRAAAECEAERERWDVLASEERQSCDACARAIRALAAAPTTEDRT